MSANFKYGTDDERMGFLMINSWWISRTKAKDYTEPVQLAAVAIPAGKGVPHVIAFQKDGSAKKLELHGFFRLYHHENEKPRTGKREVRQQQRRYNNDDAMLKFETSLAKLEAKLAQLTNGGGQQINLDYDEGPERGINPELKNN